MTDRRKLTISLALYLALAGMVAGFFWLSPPAKSPERILQEQTLEEWPNLKNPPQLIAKLQGTPPPLVPVRRLKLPALKGLKIEALTEPITLEAANFTAQIFLDTAMPNENQELYEKDFWPPLKSFEPLPPEEVDHLGAETQWNYLELFNQRRKVLRNAVFLVFDDGPAKVVLLWHPGGDIMGWFWPARSNGQGILFTGDSPTEAGAHDLIRLLGQAELIR